MSLIPQDAFVAAAHAIVAYKPRPGEISPEVGIAAAALDAAAPIIAAAAVALEVQAQDHAHDEFLDELLENAGDTWDTDAAAEAIAVNYVRHLEAEVARCGGSTRRWLEDDEVTS